MHSHRIGWLLSAVMLVLILSPHRVAAKPIAEVAKEINGHELKQMSPKIQVYSDRSVELCGNYFLFRPYDRIISIAVKGSSWNPVDMVIFTLPERYYRVVVDDRKDPAVYLTVQGDTLSYITIKISKKDLGKSPCLPVPKNP